MDTQQIKHDNPLPVVLEQYGVNLRRTGQGFIGRCPFHDDRHPSFSVFLGKGGWQFKCWGGSCGKSGDVFDFVGLALFGEAWSSREAGQFKDVLQALGTHDRSGSLSTWKTDLKPHEARPVTERVRFAWEVALSIYGDLLQHSPEAGGYIKQRRLPLDILRKYRFGYCPPEGSPLLAAAGMRRLGRRDLESAGLYREWYSRNGQPAGWYEFLKGRIVFADVDLAKNPVYLLGRALPGGGRENAVKYLGLAGFPKPLFGRASLGGGLGPVFLLEGPWDKLTLESWGYQALALMAANPSPEQVRLLQSLKRPLVPVADNDDAGRLALSTWQDAVPWLEEPLLLPREVSGVEIKDSNDLAAKLPDGEGQRLFSDLLRRRKLTG
jgi:DNA primase